MNNFRTVIIMVMLMIGCTACQQDSNAAGKSLEGNQEMTAKDNSMVLQKIIELPELQQYFHPEVPGRVPLVIKVNKGTDVSSEIEKFGQAVVITTDTPQKDAYLEVINLQHLDDRVEFEIKYEVEGLQINGELLKKSPQMFNNLAIIEI